MVDLDHDLSDVCKAVGYEASRPWIEFCSARSRRSWELGAGAICVLPSCYFDDAVLGSCLLYFVDTSNTGGFFILAFFVRIIVLRVPVRLLMVVYILELEVCVLRSVHD